MKCETCKKKEAIVHYAEVVNGKMKKMDLCEACAVEKGIGTNISMTMGDLLTGLADLETSPEYKDVETCPLCKMTYLDFKKTGRLGCSQCYKTFSQSLYPLLETIHRSSVHQGKLPVRNKKAATYFEKIKCLTEDLHKAIAREEFEKAAQIRDEIQKLESKQQKGAKKRK